MREIILPHAKPALEWINNRVLQKVTPIRQHALAQNEFAAALAMWARERGSGMSGTEWHFQVRPPGEVGRTLVPDVAFLSYARMPRWELETTEVPRIAPDVVVEVRSPDDLQADVDEKVRVYRAAGTAVVFLVDPSKRIVEVKDDEGARMLGDGDVLVHAALPGFGLRVRTLFELPEPK